MAEKDGAEHTVSFADYAAVTRELLDAQEQLTAQTALVETLRTALKIADGFLASVAEIDEEIQLIQGIADAFATHGGAVWKRIAARLQRERADLTRGMKQ